MPEIFVDSAEQWSLAVCALRDDGACSNEAFFNAVDELVRATKQEVVNVVRGYDTLIADQVARELNQPRVLDA